MLLVLAGCGKGGPKQQKKPDKEPEVPAMQIHSGPGQVDRYFDSSKGRTKSWTVNSENSTLTLDPKGAYGTMQTVKGEIYKDNKVAATFTAETGDAEKETGILRLRGNVVVNGVNPKATVKGDELEWDARIQIVKVKGNPSIDSPQIVMNTTDELWSTPDLKQVGTPDQFKK